MLYQKHTNSRVGEITKAPKPSCGPHFLLYRISRTGMRKARVLPLPVLAAPNTSFPFSDTGRLLAWISVISTKKAFFRPADELSMGSCQPEQHRHIPLFVKSDIGKSANALRSSFTF